MAPQAVESRVRPASVAAGLRTFAVGGFVAIYLSAVVVFGAFHVLGDPVAPPIRYWFTWDMFPNYAGWSARRIVLAQTRSGRYLQIFPTPRQQFRRGPQGQITRFDVPPHDAALREETEKSLAARHAASPHDPVRYVYILENYGPVGAVSATETEQEPLRRSWRITDESAVKVGEPVRWTSDR